jgi:hypothetical protein
MTDVKFSTALGCGLDVRRGLAERKTVEISTKWGGATKSVQIQVADISRQPS